MKNIAICDKCPHDSFINKNWEVEFNKTLPLLKSTQATRGGGVKKIELLIDFSQKRYIIISSR